VSTAPKRTHTASGNRSPVTVPHLAEMKRAHEPIVMVTAYDHPSAQVAEEAGVDVVLVGDTAAMVVLGYDSTVPVTMDEMLAVANAQRFLKEAGCDAVKLERGGQSVDRARAIIRAGIPVMGHVGLTPQTASALGGFKAQGKTADAAAKLAEEALALQSVGCFAIVFEAIPAAVSEALTAQLDVPVIGIGAGPATDGQVLVYHDLLGIFTGRAPKFVKRYAEAHEQMVNGMREYVAEVRARRFPDEEHSYSVDAAELEAFKGYLSTESLAARTPWDW
jgi:3-methyl-2-oxobutanoate hydroxymethyltransferase